MLESNVVCFPSDYYHYITAYKYHLTPCITLLLEFHPSLRFFSFLFFSFACHRFALLCSCAHLFSSCSMIIKLERLSIEKAKDFGIQISHCKASRLACIDGCRCNEHEMHWKIPQWIIRSYGFALGLYASFVYLKI